MADPREERERWRILERFLDANNLADAAEATWRAELLKKLDTYIKAVEGLPEALLAYCELKIYDLRNERHLARKAGVLTAPAPLLPEAPRPRRDQLEEITGVFDLEHTDGAKKKAHELIGQVVVWLVVKGWQIGIFKWALAGAFYAISHAVMKWKGWL